MRKASVAEAKARLPELIRAVEDGEDVVVTRNGVAVVRLAPVERQSRRHWGFAAHRGRGRVGADFDNPIEDFGPYER